MALVKLGETIIGLRGTIGGLTFSANKNGPYCKKLVVPVATRTILQSVMRSRFAAIRADWSACTPEQVAAWEALAADPPEVDYNPFGEIIYLSGSAWHMRVNMRRLEAGDEIERDCPENTPVVPPVSFGLTIYPSSDEIDASVFSYTEGDFDGFYAALRLSVCRGAVRNVQSTGWMTIWCGTVEGDTETVITEELVGAFGGVYVGQKVFGELRKQSPSGIRSTQLTATAIVEEV